MNEQEMQFADPEWRPLEDGMVQARQEPYVPQPINRGPREPAMWQTGASAPPSDAPPIQPGPYAGGYAPQQERGRQYGVPGRKSRNPWFLIIVILIGFSVMSGGLFSRPGSGPDHSPFGKSWMHPAPQLFVVGTSSVPTIVIHGQSGHIHVNRGLDTDKVMVDASNKDAVQYNKDSNQLTVNDSSEDLTVTVPGNATLQINTQSGNIDVQGVDGQMVLVSNSGTIHVEHGTLKGQSILKSDSGSVSFNGLLDPNGSYQFESNSDAVNVTLPANASFHVDASTNTGSIKSDFSSVVVQQGGSNGGQAHGDVGNQPRPMVTLTTNNGEIHLHQAS